MSDIVKTLRSYPGDPTAVMTIAFVNEVADRIEELESNCAKLEKAHGQLQKIIDRLTAEIHLALHEE